MGKRREKRVGMGFFLVFWGLGDGMSGLIETGYRKPIKGRGGGVVSGGKWKVEGGAEGGERLQTLDERLETRTMGSTRDSRHATLGEMFWGGEF